MTFEELNNELNKLIGQPVTFKRIAGNSIIVYFFGGPGDATVHSIWFDPTWRYEQRGKIVVGSFDFPWSDDFKTKDEYENEFHRICGLVESTELVGSILVRFSLDSASSDLTLEFSGNKVLRNFANSAFAEMAWTYRNLPTGVAANISPRGITLWQPRLGAKT